MSERIARQSAFTVNGRKRENIRYVDGQVSERYFDEEGRLILETHEVAAAGLRLKAESRFGHWEETYRAAHGPADRDAYETARQPWPDMPLARPPETPPYPRLRDRVMLGNHRRDTWQISDHGIRVEEIAGNGQRLGASETDKRPDGVTVSRQLDAELDLRSEKFRSPDNRLTVEFHYDRGLISGVFCFAAASLISSRRYEKERVRYPGMPPVGPGQTDGDATLKLLLKEERQARRERNCAASPDPAIAAQRDAFCQAILDDGAPVEAFGWMTGRRNTLGERDRTASRRLMDRLASCGPEAVYACEREELDAGAWSAASLVVRLPQDRESRRKLFAFAEKLAEKQGFEDGADHGQSLLFLRM